MDFRTTPLTPEEIKQQEDKRQENLTQGLPQAYSNVMSDMDKLGLPKEQVPGQEQISPPIQPMQENSVVSPYISTLDKYRQMLEKSQVAVPTDMIEAKAAAPMGMSSSTGLSDATLQQQLKKAEQMKGDQQVAAMLAMAGQQMGAGMAGGKLAQIKPNLAMSEMLQKTGEEQHKDILDRVRLQQANDIKKSQMQMMAAQRQALMDAKKQQVEDNRISARVANFNRNIASDKQVQTAQATLGRVNNLKALVNSFENGKIPASQLTSELAGSIENVIRGGNSAVATLHEFLPKDAAGSVQKFKEWITSEPQGVDRTKYINLMKHLVEREEGAAQSVIKDASLRQVRGWKHEDADRPEIQDMMAARGILDKYNAIRSGEKIEENPYTKELNESFKKGPEAVKMPLSEHDKQAQEWAKANPADPRAQKILDMLKMKGY